MRPAEFYSSEAQYAFDSSYLTPFRGQSMTINFTALSQTICQKCATECYVGLMLAMKGLLAEGESRRTREFM
jgi:hypothetical protein